VWRRAWGVTAAGVLTAALLTPACHATPAAVAKPGDSPPTATTKPVNSAGPVVALGDSYTAGALLPLDTSASPAGCLRSAKAYPVLVARALGAQVKNAACASAGVKNMTQPQRTYMGTNPAQLDALAPGDRIVLLTLGGDDVGFLNVLKECVALSFTNPFGRPCAGHYAKGGTDQLAATVTTLAPKIATTLAAIAVRAPRARIIVVGYPDVFPQSGGCWPAVPIADGDIAYLRGIEVKLNARLAAAAQAAADTFVNTYAPTTGHDFCTAESVRDVEGLLPGSLALPFHPNARGQQVMADAVLTALN
jgi:lysophospholipase L1-like esterase